MTLHWWMHWFWVTALLAALVHGAEEPRMARAMYFQKPITTLDVSTISSTTILSSTLLSTTTTASSPTFRVPLIKEASLAQPTGISKLLLETLADHKLIDKPTLLPDLTAEKRPISSEANETTTVPSIKEWTKVNATLTEAPLNLSVLDEKEATKNVGTIERNNSVRPAVSESVSREVGMSDGWKIGAAVGSVAALMGVASLVAAAWIGVKKWWSVRSPLTFHDKCSNPDSSGYLDDTTVRDNSEEMYSLDNDSFLNSLEAMTIHNYWTDTVKHTKL